MLENTEKLIKNGQSRETNNIWYTKRRNTQQKYDTTRVGHHHMQANTNNTNKTCSLRQTAGGNREPIVVFMRKW